MNGNAGEVMKFELNQKKAFAAERQFSFKDKNTLSITLKNLNRHKEYLIDLAALDPKSRSHFAFAIKSLASFILFLSLSLIFFLTSALDFLNSTYQDWAVSGAIIGTLISLISFISFTRYERVFVARESKVPLVYFYNSFLNKKELNEFTDYISKESQRRFKELALDTQQQRVGEMKTIRRIFDDGILTPIQYEKAKAKLLKLHDD